MFLQQHLQVKSDLSALAQILPWFDQIYQPEISRKVWLQCQTALAEGFTNAVRHAHRDLAVETPIDLEVGLEAGQIQIQIWDQGPPFDFDQKLNGSLAVDTGATGGRGLRLMNLIADELSYSRTADHRNCLRIIKYYTS